MARADRSTENSSDLRWLIPYGLLAAAQGAPSVCAWRRSQLPEGSTMRYPAMRRELVIRLSTRLGFVASTRAGSHLHTPFQSGPHHQAQHREDGERVEEHGVAR